MRKMRSIINDGARMQIQPVLQSHHGPINKRYHAIEKKTKSNYLNGRNLHFPIGSRH